jgi:hypothetical protein
MQTATNYPAFVFLAENSGAFDKIYGLTVLERTFHALERGGVTSVFLPLEWKDRIESVIRRKADWKCDFHFTKNFGEVWPASAGGLLMLSQPLVLDPKIPQEFLAKNSSATQVLVLKNGTVAFFPAAGISKMKTAELPAGADFQSWLNAAKQHGISTAETNFPGLICAAVNTPEEKKTVKKALIRSLTKPTDGWVSRNLNRPISTNISRVLAYTSITPNQFTIITGMAGIATGVFAAMGGDFHPGRRGRRVGEVEIQIFALRAMARYAGGQSFIRSRTCRNYHWHFSHGSFRCCENRSRPGGDFCRAGAWKFVPLSFAFQIGRHAAQCEIQFSGRQQLVRQSDAGSGCIREAGFVRTYFFRVGHYRAISHGVGLCRHYGVFCFRIFLAGTF